MKYLIDTNILINYVLQIPEKNLSEDAQKNLLTFGYLHPEDRLIPDFVLAQAILFLQKGIFHVHPELAEDTKKAQCIEEVTRVFLYSMQQFANVIAPLASEISQASRLYIEMGKAHPLQQDITFSDILLVLMADRNTAFLLTHNEKAQQIFTKDRIHK